ncbi:AAA family ATPase, partial [Escherichia coli]|uniref:AAA family ATPase n=1 Tax=Escherichia coli TaxID=562 RepID=UPI003F529510
HLLSSIALAMGSVVVVGTSGAGKSTFSAALAARLGCTHVELDRLYWGPGWQAVPHERFELE